MFRVGYVISNVDKVLHIGQQKTQVDVKAKRVLSTTFKTEFDVS